MTSTSWDFSSPFLTSLSSSLISLKSSHIHPSFLPISILTLLHAARVSHASSSLSPTNSPLFQSTALALILLFAGSVISFALLALPSPILLAWNTILVYSTTHILLTLSGLSNTLITISKSRFGVLLDVALHLIDGICRSEGIVMLGVESVRNHPNPLVRQSTFAALLIGTLIGGGGPIILSIFTLIEPNWNLRTPTFLTSPLNLLSVDIWSSTFVSFLYLVFTTPGGLPSLLPSTSSVASTPGSSSFSLFSNQRIFFNSSFQSVFESSSNLILNPLLQTLEIRPTKKTNLKKFHNFITSSNEQSLLNRSEAQILCGLVLFAILAINRSGRDLLKDSGEIKVANLNQLDKKTKPQNLKSKSNATKGKSLPEIPPSNGEKRK